MKQEETEQWIETLKILELWQEEDRVEGLVRGIYYEFMGQVGGSYIFTEQQITFVSRMGTTTFSARYKDICAIKKSFVGPFLPFGVTIVVKNPQSGKEKKYKISILGRKKWIEYLSSKTGIIN